MALFFDLTGLPDWPHPYLTGVQRVVVHVLSELLRSRSDVSLIRYEPLTQSFVSSSLADLPEAALKFGNLTGVSNQSAAVAPVSDIATDDAAKPDQPRLRTRVLRRAPPNVQVAVLNVRKWVRDLRDTFRNWLAPSPKKPDAPEDVMAARMPTPQSHSPVFRPDDVCLCIGFSWFRPGYWEALAAVRRQGTKVVQLIHDIGFITQPQWVSPSEATEGTQWFAKATENADLLLVTSRFQQTEIETHLQSAKLKIRPLGHVRLGDDPSWLMKQPGSPARSTRVPCHPFVLYVSGFYVRKNHHALYHVWRQLVQQRGDSSPHLVLVGTLGPVKLDVIDQILADPLTRNRVHIRTDVGDDELSDLYRSCLFTVYPSYYEGWGLPIAESLRLGRYCIASSSASLPEIGGDLIDYADPFDHAALLHCVARAIDDPAYVRAREAKIRRNYRPWSWSSTARQISERVDCVMAARADVRQP